MRAKILSVLQVAAICLLGLSLTQANAGDLSVQISQSAEFENNAFSTEIDKKSETTLDTNVSASWQKISRNIDVAFDYSMSHLTHQQDRFDDSRKVEGFGQMVWHILPGRADWYISDNENYTIVDRRLADTDDNRAQQSSFATGPSYTLALSSVDSVIFNADYTRSTLDNESDSKSEVKSAAVNWSHRFSQTRDFLVSLSNEKTEFGNANDELETLGLSTKLNILTASGNITLGAGIDKLKRGVNTDVKSNSVNLGYNRSWSQSYLSITASRDLTDTISSTSQGEFIANSLGISEQNSDTFDDFLSSKGVNTDQRVDIEDAVARTDVGFDIGTSLFTSLTQVSFFAGYSKEDLQSVDDVQRVFSYEVSGSHTLSGQLSVASTYGYEKIAFNSLATNRTDYGHNVSAGITYSASSYLSLSAEASLSRRHFGTEENGAHHYDVSEKSLTISATYQAR